MSFAAGYIAQLEAFAARGYLPRIKALHLPPLLTEENRDAKNSENKGEFCALELDDGALGLSYVLLDDTLEALRRKEGGFALTGADALAVARGYLDEGLNKMLGFAAANALTRCLYDRAGFVPPPAGDSIGRIDPQPGERIGMIGLFKPLLGRILDSGTQLTVVELNPELVGERDGYVVTLDASALEACTKVVSTSTLLLNDTLDRMLTCCRNARWFALVGPSAGCLPDALFARGVTLLGGNWVTEPAGFIDALRRGESTSLCAHKTALTPDNYPGLAALQKLL